jgi:hypothetical protein
VFAEESVGYDIPMETPETETYTSDVVVIAAPEYIYVPHTDN